MEKLDWQKLNLSVLLSFIFAIYIDRGIAGTDRKQLDKLVPRSGTEHIHVSDDRLDHVLHTVLRILSVPQYFERWGIDIFPILTVELFHERSIAVAVHRQNNR